MLDKLDDKTEFVSKKPRSCTPKSILGDYPSLQFYTWQNQQLFCFVKRLKLIIAPPHHAFCYLSSLSNCQRSRGDANTSADRVYYAVVRNNSKI